MESKTSLVILVIGLLVGSGLGSVIFTQPLKTENSQLYRSITTLETQVQSLTSELGELEEDCKDELEKIATLTQEINLLTTEKNNALSQLVSEQNRVEDLEDQVDELESQLEIEYIDSSFSRTEDTCQILCNLIDHAGSSIKIMVLLITEDTLADALIDAHNRGVDVIVIIDDDYQYTSGSEYTRIRDSGIDIRTDNRSGLMHHKVMIIDWKILVIGSYNWSQSAEDSNDENVIILNSEKIAGEYQIEFNRILGQTIKYVESDSEPESEPTEYILTLILSGSGSVEVAEWLFGDDYDSPGTYYIPFTIEDRIPDDPIQIKTYILDEVQTVKLDGVDVTDVKYSSYQKTSGYSYISYDGDYGTWKIYMDEDHTVEITFSDDSSSSGGSGSSGGIYVASKNSEVFHLLTCHYVDSILEENKVYFDSREDAINSGRRPCKSCNP